VIFGDAGAEGGGPSGVPDGVANILGVRTSYGEALLLHVLGIRGIMGRCELCLFGDSLRLCNEVLVDDA
jgi:hypothetical protein